MSFQGIFRDVPLLAFPSESIIEDWFVRADFNGVKGYVEATIDIKTKYSAFLALTVRAQPQYGGKTLARLETYVYGDRKVKINVDVAAPRTWTAETPHLYTVELALTPMEPSSVPHFVHEKAGFRRVELIGGLLCVNGTAVQLRGVNRRDHHPRFGRAVPVEYIRRDPHLMKAHNINALQCSYHPSHPKLYDLADEIGLWAIDETDLECRGFYNAVARTVQFPEGMNWWQGKQLIPSKVAELTSNNPLWKPAYLDRIEQMIQRDKNHPSIVVWSLGCVVRDSSHGQNPVGMYEYAKCFDPWRVHSADTHFCEFPPVENLVELAATGVFDKPVILYKYAHAMGNEPGGLEGCEKAFRAHVRLQGGFVWEWANHGLWKEEKDGKSYCGYDRDFGDFGDFPSIGGFAMAGLLHSNHTPTPGLLELKKVAQPVKITQRGSNIVITNHYDFIGLHDLLLIYKTEELGEE